MNFVRRSELYPPKKPYVDQMDLVYQILREQQQEKKKQQMTQTMEQERLEQQQQQRQQQEQQQEKQQQQKQQQQKQQQQQQQRQWQQPPPPPKKQKISTTNIHELTQNQRDRLLQRAIAKAKVTFEQEKQQVLDSLSDEYKKRFNEIVLIKCGYATGKFPCLIMNPYDIPADPQRMIWLNMIKAFKAEQRMEFLCYIAYPYGTTDFNDPYTWISSSQITMCEAEIKRKKKLSRLWPTWVQNEVKFRGAANASSLAQNHLRRYDEMQADLQLEPSQRRRGILEYKETYELLRWEEIAQSDLDELIDDDENFQDDPANMQPSTIDAKESNQDNENTKRKRNVEEDIESSNEKINVPEAEKADNNKRTKLAAKGIEKNVSATLEEKHALPALQGSKAATLHQREDTMESSTEINNNSRNHVLLKPDDAKDHNVPIDQDGKRNHNNNNVVVPGGKANQGRAATRIVDGVADVPRAQMNSEMMIAEASALTTNAIHGDNTELSQAVKNLMLAMAQLVDVAERPKVAAAPHIRRGVRRPSEMLLHTSRRMAEMAVELASTETEENR